MIINILGLLISIYAYFSLPLSIGYIPSLVVVLLIAVFEIIELLRHGERFKNLKKQYLRIFPVFLFSFVCVHFQQFLDIVLGYNNFMYPEYSNELLITKTAFLSLIGLSSLLIGYRCYNPNVVYASQKYFSHNNLYNTTRLKNTFTLLFVAFTILFVLLNGKAYLSGQYSQEMMAGMQGSLNAYSSILLQCSMYSVIIETIRSIAQSTSNCSIKEYIKSFSIVFYICLFVILFLNLLLGDRGPLITYICIYVFGYIVVSKKKFRLTSILIIGFVFAIVMSVISIYRTSDDKTLSQFQGYKNEIDFESSISPYTADLAGSTYATILAVESTPDLYPYRYGFFSLNNILSAIPFSTTLLNFIGINSTVLEYCHSSSFLTWYGHGGDMTRSGLGSSTVADAYIDFGPVGVIVILFLIGLFFHFLDIKLFVLDVNQLRDIILIAGFVFFAHALYFPRSMVFFFLKDVIWTWAFYKVFCLFGKKRLK